MSLLREMEKRARGHSGPCVVCKDRNVLAPGVESWEHGHSCPCSARIGMSVLQKLGVVRE